jgi:hypothetical protein
MGVNDQSSDRDEQATKNDSHEAENEEREKAHCSLHFWGLWHIQSGFEGLALLIGQNAR